MCCFFARKRCPAFVFRAARMQSRVRVNEISLYLGRESLYAGFFFPFFLLLPFFLSFFFVSFSLIVFHFFFFFILFPSPFFHFARNVTLGADAQWESCVEWHAFNGKGDSSERNVWIAERIRSSY